MSPAPSIESTSESTSVYAFSDRIINPDSPKTLHSAVALAVSSTGSVVARTQGLGKGVSDAVATCLAEMLPELNGPVSVMPHRRSDYALGLDCSCPVCHLVRQGTCGDNVTTQTGSLDALGCFVDTQHASLAEAQRLADEHRMRSDRISTYRITGSESAIPIAESFDESGRICGRRVRSPKEAISIWTDASVSTDLVGIAAVDEEGRRSTEGFRDAESPNHTMRVLHGELLAILAAVQTWVGRADQLTVHSDSQNAVKLLDAALFSNSVSADLPVTVSRTVTRIAALVRNYREIGGRVNFGWVRGHEGEAHNEAAHRMANTARRSFEWNLGVEMTARQMDNIVDDLRRAGGTRDSQAA